MIKDDILYIVVSCVKETSRLNVLKKVVENFNYNFINEYDIQDSLLVIDNGSTPETVELLKNNFKNVYRSETNLGYWTVLYWAINNAEQLLNKKFKYVHIMEADHIYHDVYKFEWCKKLLDDVETISSIKIHEYYPHLYYLYNKGAELPNSRKHDWISHNSLDLDNRTVSLKKIIDYHDHFYLSNFRTQLHNITRFNLMIECFDELKNMKSFNEGNFHKLYFQKGPFIAVLNGGLFNMKLGYSDVVAGSAQGWTPEVEKEFKKHGYVQTNVDTILEDNSYIIQKV